jgi:hypothetical protein
VLLLFVVLVVVVEVVVTGEEVGMGEGFTMEDTMILGIGDMGGMGDTGVTHTMVGRSGRFMGMIRERYRVRMRKGLPHRVRIRFLISRRCWIINFINSFEEERLFEGC